MPKRDWAEPSSATCMLSCHNGRGDQRADSRRGHQPRRISKRLASRRGSPLARAAPLPPEHFGTRIKSECDYMSPFRSRAPFVFIFYKYQKDTFSRPLGNVIDTSPRPRQTRATCPVVAKQWSTGGRRSSLPLGGWALSSRDVAGNTKGFKLACELLYNSQLVASRNCRRQRLQSLMKSPATLGCIVCATIILHPALVPA